jgi:hypothetical protein
MASTPAARPENALPSMSSSPRSFPPPSDAPKTKKMPWQQLLLLLLLLLLPLLRGQ